MKWIKVSSNILPNGKYVFLKGCRVDRGTLMRSHNGEYIELYRSSTLVTRWAVGNPELNSVEWLDEEQSPLPEKEQEAMWETFMKEQISFLEKYEGPLLKVGQVIPMGAVWLRFEKNSYWLKIEKQSPVTMDYSII